jgi:hypothetical protein
MRYLRVFAVHGGWAAIVTTFALAGCGHSSSSNGPSDGGQSNPEGGSAGDDSGNGISPGDDDDSSGDSGGKPVKPKGDGGAGGRESWVWIYDGYNTAMTTVVKNKASFTHVSPAFYSLNYDYQSGVAYYANCPTSGSDVCTGNGTNSFNGLTTKQFTAQATAAGIETHALIYAGSENMGSDTGVQNILDDTNGAGTSFISAMTTEAVNNGYSGYNLDWEMGGPINKAYAAKFVTFVNDFKTALAPQGISLSVDAIVSNINGTNCSGNNGYLDFGLLATSQIDRILIEDYIDTFGKATTSCQNVTLSDKTPPACDYTLTGMLNMMCAPNLPLDKAVIAIDADPGSTNPIAGSAMSAITSYGFTRVAVWPQDPFMNTSGIQPAGSSWYTLLATFLAK